MSAEPTPRTDAQPPVEIYDRLGNAYASNLIDPDFARTLERELAAQIAVTQTWVDENGDLHNKLATLRDQLAAAYPTIEVDGMVYWPATIRELREQLARSERELAEAKERLVEWYSEEIPKIGIQRARAEKAEEQLARSEEERVNEVEAWKGRCEQWERICADRDRWLETACSNVDYGDLEHDEGHVHEEIRQDKLAEWRKRVNKVIEP